LSQLPSYETLLTQLAAGMLGTVSQVAIGLNMLVEKGQEA
jgi:ribosomal protein L10